MKSYLISKLTDSEYDSEGEHPLLGKENGVFFSRFLEIEFNVCNNEMLVFGITSLWHDIDALGNNEVKDEKPKPVSIKANATKPESSVAKPKEKIVEPKKPNDDSDDEESDEEDSDDEVCNREKY